MYKDLIARNIKNDSSKVCQLSFSNEIGCVIQEVETRIPTNTNTMFQILKHKVPLNSNVIYGRLVCDIRPQKL